MPRGRRPKNRQRIAPSFAVLRARRARSRGRRERRGAADPGDEDPGDERARNRPDPLSLGSALRGAALAFLLCRERHDGSPAEVRDSSVGSASSGGHGDKRRTTGEQYIFRYSLTGTLEDCLSSQGHVLLTIFMHIARRSETRKKNSFQALL